MINGEYVSTPGMYDVFLTTVNGCDSMYVLDLGFVTVDTSVVLSADTLSAVQAGATYQWIDCETGLAVPGATESSFVPTLSGSYALEVTVDACTQVSECYTVIINSVKTIEQSKDVSVYPNPTDQSVLINTLTQLQIAQVDVYTVQGRLVNSVPVAQESMELIMPEAPGMYLLHIILDDGTIRLAKVIKE